jgi:hypothetical protein
VTSVKKPSRTAAIALLGAAALAVAGCDLGSILPHYTGPLPQKLPLVNERVVVRETIPSSIFPGAVGGFYGERTQFTERGEPHNVNRVVYVSGGARSADLAALGVDLGDTLLISTQYDTTYYTSVAPDAVPDWPGHEHLEYPVGNHTLTAVARTE